MAFSKTDRRYKIKKRIRKDISGTEKIPRMSVFRSNKHISVQIIDDVAGKTLVSASSRCKEIQNKKSITKTDQAKFVGKLIAEKAAKAGVDTIVYDRNGFLYHGRIKALADAAREGGLKF